MTLDFVVHLIADAAVIPVVLIGVWALLFKVPKGQRFASYSRVLMAGLTAYLLARFAASIYQPTDLRPFQLMGVDPGALYLNNPGFPSDHTLFATAIICAVWFETRLKKTTVVLVGLLVLISIGRVLALVHTPTDVIGGILIALVGALWYSNIPRRAKNQSGGQGESISGKSGPIRAKRRS